MGHYRGYRTDSTRLEGWDYRRPRWYFITICTHGRTPFFGDVRDGVMELSPVGDTAHRFWDAIPDHCDRARLDAFVVMPNHVHGLIGLVVETLDPTSPRRSHDPGPGIDKHMSDISPKPGSISTIVRSYKAAVTRWARRNGYADFRWQSRFHDHIVRHPAAFQRIRRYIIDNPARWEQDCSYEK